MRRALSVVLVLVLALMLVSVGAVGAKAPGTGDRTGELDLRLNLGAVLGVGDFQDVVWMGTITFDEGTYGIAYFTVGTHANEVASHWTEEWAMYDYDESAPFFEFTGPFLTTFDPGDPVVEGSDSGMTHWKNFTWVGNGRVEMAEAPFEQWEGRNAHTSGEFNPAEGWGTGIVRFN